MISNSGHDENGKIHSGKAGDQTKTEWEIRAWYNKPWAQVLVHPDPKVRAEIAKSAREAAENDNIGYDQWQRTTFWDELKKVNYVVKDIKTPCESDCSGGVAAICKAIGYRLGIKSLQDISEKTYTGDMLKNFKAAGFTVLTDPKYLTSEDYLEPGYILFIHDDKKGKHHTAIALDYGKKAQPTNQNEAPKKSESVIVDEVIAGKWGNNPERAQKLSAAGYDPKKIQTMINDKLSKKTPAQPVAPQTNKYRVININSYLNVRKGPGISHPSVGKLYNDDVVEVVSISNSWAKLTNGNYVATQSSKGTKYLEKI